MEHFGFSYYSKRKAQLKYIVLKVLLPFMLVCVFSGCGPDIKSKDPNVRKAAVQKLTDQSVLAKIAMEDKDESVREAAVQKVTDPTILKFTKAFYTVPPEHRVRLMGDILPAIHVLSRPEVVNKVGEITSIRAQWSPLRCPYFSFGHNRGRDIEAFQDQGEEFTCSIELRNLSIPLSHSWCTEFPHAKTYRTPFVIPGSCLCR